MSRDHLRIPNPRIRLLNALGVLLVASSGAVALVVHQGPGRTPPVAYLAGGGLLFLGVLLLGVRHWKALERSSQTITERLTLFAIPIRTNREKFPHPAEIEVRKEVVQGRDSRRIAHRVYLMGKETQLRVETFSSAKGAEKLAAQLRAIVSSAG